MSRGLPASFLVAVVALLSLALAGCSEDVPSGDPTSVPTRLPVFATPATATAEASAEARLTSAEVTALLAELVCWHDDPELAAECLPVGPEEAELLQQVARSADARFVAPLIDMLWLDLGWDRWIQEALEAITGQEFADGYGWSAWLAVERTPLPDGYLEWKGRLLSLVDERFVELLNNDLLLAVRADELIWTRVAIDERPPLLNPETVHRLEERYLADSDVVFGVFLNGEARAYPQRILAWHDLVIDELGGRSLIVTNCVPCGGTAVYEATASDGVQYEFGNAGLVYHSRRLYYDTATSSLWDGLTGEAVGGPALLSGASLTPVPVVRTTWSEWAGRHPNSTVLSLDTGAVRNYDAGAALSEERSFEGPQYPAPAPADASIQVKERILGLELGGATRAYSLAAIEAAGLVHDTLGGQEIVLVSRGPGLGVSVYHEDGVAFSYMQGSLAALELVDTEGERWFLDEEVLVNVIDSRLRRAIPTRLAYWFAWADAYPETTLWGS